VPGRSRRRAVRVAAAPPAQVQVELPVQEPEPVRPERVPEPVRPERVPGPVPQEQEKPVRPGRALVQPGALVAEGRIRPASSPPPCPPGRSQCPATPRTNAGTFGPDGPTTPAQIWPFGLLASLNFTS
jgi:hypothetical protein